MFRNRAAILLLGIISSISSAKVPSLTETPRKCDRNSLRIALDIGHDNIHSGAISARGRTEFSYNLALARLVLARLQYDGFGYVFLIGENGIPMQLADRPMIAREQRANLFISLHHDSVQKQFFSEWTFEGRVRPYSDVFHGYSIFVSTASAQAYESTRLATALGKALQQKGLTPSLHHAQKIPGEGRSLLDPALGVYQFNELAVLRGSTMPALLLESAVIVNRDEEMKIISGSYHPRIAAALSEAIEAYCRSTQ